MFGLKGHFVWDNRSPLFELSLVDVWPYPDPSRTKLGLVRGLLLSGLQILVLLCILRISGWQTIIKLTRVVWRNILKPRVSTQE